jgi:DNA-binding winged helix-turn-helix (wHTH) protein
VHLWPRQFVSDATLDACLAQERQAVGDSGRSQRVIQTRHGYGYRFVADAEICPETRLNDAAVAFPLISSKEPGTRFPMPPQTWRRTGIPDASSAAAFPILRRCS